VKIDAAVLRSATGRFELEALDLPAPGPDEAVIRVVGVGLCHTDLLPRAGGPFAVPPIVVGHEAAGIVEAVGRNVEWIALGDHVVASFAYCDQCKNCLDGHPAYCDDFFQLNLHGAPCGSVVATDADGNPVSTKWFGQSSFATHAVVAARSLVRIDPELPLDLLGPLGCGILTGAASILRALKVTPDSSVAVFGAGTVGMSAVMTAHLVGAKTIAVVDLHESRLALARELGATETLVPHEDRLEEQLRDILPGGFQYCFDTTGVPSVIASAVAALRVTGTCGLVGVQHGALKLPSTALTSGRTVTAILLGDAVPRQTIPELLGYWKQGRFPFERLLTQYPMSEINAAERDCATGVVVKPVLIPGT
jgi:aryl-alcohol dehydrogenase